MYLPATKTPVLVPDWSGLLMSPRSWPQLWPSHHVSFFFLLFNSEVNYLHF